MQNKDKREKRVNGNRRRKPKGKGAVISEQRKIRGVIKK